MSATAFTASSASSATIITTILNPLLNPLAWHVKYLTKISNHVKKLRNGMRDLEDMRDDTMERLGTA